MNAEHTEWQAKIYSGP